MTDQQRNLFTGRWRRSRPPVPKEYQTQIALVSRLKLQASKSVMYWHTPNGEARDKRTAARLKAMGVMPGVGDLQFIWWTPKGVRILFLELKRKGGVQTPEQVAFEIMVTTCGCSYYVADSIDAAVAILKAEGILP